MAEQPQLRVINHSELKVKNILFADFSIVKFEPVVKSLKQVKVESECVTDSDICLARIHEKEFDVIIMNLLLGGQGPFDLIRKLRAASKNPDVRIMVISKQVHKDNIQNAIRAGASDFVCDPFEDQDLQKRIVYHLTPKKVVDPSRFEKSSGDIKNQAHLKVLLDAIELLSKTERGKEHQCFFNICSQIAKLMGSNRTSIMIVDIVSASGLVIATSDDPTFYDFPTKLQNYPEVLHAIYSGQLVLVEDVGGNKMTQEIQDKVKSIQIGSLMVFPVHFQNEIAGVLTIRHSEAIELPSMDVLRILQSIANAMAAYAHLRSLLRKIYKSFAAKQVPAAK